MKRYAPPDSPHARQAPLVPLIALADTLLSPRAYVWMQRPEPASGGFAKLEALKTMLWKGPVGDPPELIAHPDDIAKIRGAS